jgi:hypothetical protein
MSGVGSLRRKEGNTRPPQFLQVYSEEKKKFIGTHASPVPWRQSWALVAEVALWVHSDDSGSSRSAWLMPRKENRVFSQPVFVGEMSVTLLP